MVELTLGPYQIDNIYCGECASMMSRLPDNCIDLIVTSPPYDPVDENMVTHPGKGLRDYQSYTWDFINVAKQLWRVIKKGGVVVWVSVRSNIWRYNVGNNGDNKTIHPAKFPEALARDHIISWSNPGALVLDPFIGSGTVAKICIEQNRHYLGFDISQKYVNFVNERIQSARVPLPGIY